MFAVLFSSFPFKSVDLQHQKSNSAGGRRNTKSDLKSGRATMEETGAAAAAAMSTEEAPRLACAACGITFESRNKMFKHLKNSACSELPPERKPEKLGLLFGYDGAALPQAQVSRAPRPTAHRYHHDDACCRSSLLSLARSTRPEVSGRIIRTVRATWRVGGLLGCRARAVTSNGHTRCWPRTQALLQRPMCCASPASPSKRWVAPRSSL